MKFHTQVIKLTLRIALGLLIASPALHMYAGESNGHGNGNGHGGGHHGDNGCDCDCDNDIRIKRLCAKILTAECIDSDKITSRDLCAKYVKGKTSNFENTSIKNELCAHEIGASVAKLGTVYANDLCVSGTLTANAYNICNNVRAALLSSAPTLYTLGSIINWDVLFDNPGGHASLIPYAHFTAPVAGYYMVTLQVDVSNILPVSGKPLLGLPVANPQIYINNVLYREVFLPFLSFVNSQASTISTLVKLAAGDELTSKYDILYLDEVTGFGKLVGTVVINGNGTTDNKSLFEVILLGTDCTKQCEPVVVCTPSPCEECRPCCERDDKD